MPGGPGERPRSSAPGAIPSLGLVPELALGGVTLAAAVSLARLFSGTSFLGPVLIALIVSHLVAAASRRAGVRLLPSILISSVAMVLVLGWVIEPAATAFGLPGAKAWHTAGHDLSNAWQLFKEAVAPVATSRGYVLSAAIAVWTAGFLADAAAFRLGATFEALVPSFTLFLFSSALGTNRHRVFYAALELLAVLVFVLVRTADRGARSAAWFGGRGRAGAPAIARGGVGALAAAVALAALLGPRLPGSRSGALVNWRSGAITGTGSRVTVSPLVDIRNRLVAQSNVDAFTVQSNHAAYWRLTSLDHFDGTIWSSLGTYRPASGGLSVSGPEPAGVLVSQHYAIAALSSFWLPAAFRPFHLQGASGVRFDPESASLLTEKQTADGLRYQLDSVLPDLTPPQLQGAPDVDPADIVGRYLGLPATFPRRVAALAEEVVSPGSPFAIAACQAVPCSVQERGGGRLSPYHRALALEKFFRSPPFTYDLNAPAGHDNEALETFLFGTHRGYCEQFAGAYAAMARVVGLPSRVAVGFTPGELVSANTYRVRGRDAHAWPEVYLAGAGWVPFEPTPTRANPSASAWTFVQPSAAASGGSQSGASASPTTTTVPAPAPSLPSPRRVSGAQNPTLARRPSHWLTRLGLWLGIVIATLMALASIAPTTRFWRRRRRRWAASTPAARVLVSWEEAVESLTIAGLGRQPAETAREYARRIVAGSATARALAGLAEDAEGAAWSPRPVDEGTADRAEEAARDVGAALWASAAPMTRVRWVLDPRPLLASRTGRRPAVDQPR